MTRIKIVILIALLLIASFAIWYALSRGEGKNIEIMDRFDDKIVYTTDMSQSEEPFRAHCKEAGGLFNSCGSPCPTHEDICASVCAYTCEEL